MLRCMRTTLTLDDDVAALLRSIQKQRKLGLKELVNAGLREGLQRLGAKRRRAAPFQTRVVSLGQCRLASLDDVAEALVAAEGEAFR
jgi:hypothetical protein